MKRSTDRILTTHTGSLPRPDDLVGLLEGHDQREVRADPDYQARVAEAVKETVRKQAEAGMTVVNDGEMSKVGYATYVTDRLTGFSEQDGPSRPGVVWQFLTNEPYPTHEAYVFAVADAMRSEYEAIVQAGFVLQLDCPELALGWNGYLFADATVDDFRKVADLHVAALNHAIATIPADRVRLHLCWGKPRTSAISRSCASWTSS